MASEQKRRQWAEQARARQARQEQQARQPQPISYVKVFFAVLAALLVALWIFTNVAHANIPAAKMLQVADPHPLTVKRAMGVAERFYYEYAGHRRASGRVIQLRVISWVPIDYEDGTTTIGDLHTRLTVKLYKDGRLTVYDSLLSDRPTVVP